MRKFKQGDLVRIRKDDALSQSCCHLIQEGCCKSCPIAKKETFIVKNYETRTRVRLESLKYKKVPCGDLRNCSWYEENLEKAYNWIKMEK